MCRVDYCDEFAEEISRETPTARKAHRCGECGRAVEPGERYERIVAKWDGDLTVSKTCSHCVRARRWLERECGGFVYTEVADELAEHWQESAEYRTKELRALIMGMRRGWRRRGELLPIPA